MKKTNNIKAIILAAGVGSRIRPLTDNCPKSLLKIGDKTILEMMVSHIQACGINEIVFVLGYLENHIKDFVGQNFPDLNVHFITNEHYANTNTGYSLMLTEEFVKSSAFIKFDADVVFDIEILKNLIDSEYTTCLCVDKNINLEAEEIKVIVDENGHVIKASKEVNPNDAVGESIGIEKISNETAQLLFAELKEMMKDKTNHQQYYEAGYERLIAKNVIFNVLDITGLKWTEIDTIEDFATAERIFNHCITKQ
ncbi:phosphocholine cytidylyltransferase family protein [Shewanella sp. D64]|uniref:phosphocholine cytidylyltransferase family protein n=1 Tax=unclassified Shewanella TaxID=196818 RepID=UPI0022BA29EA|nr:MULTISPECIES: phosphocholine cytidylyltransferase family protein [unclassified Shewanella]MEC4727908.1 phosphocholine cytidylyltransferase family protein [Shewanella sp. D64]MEC4739950.1 phosphocholine cytidylyltransferase family protein [Shewanella sp. E94]WBJ97088.1 phosphocholine cytidylyltransferase family protein [Shewanella sp. MTB7]